MAVDRIPAAWADLPFFREEWPRIRAVLDAAGETVLPPAGQRFAALEPCPPESVRVVILGQDPYPTPGHAHGLAFSVPPQLRPLPRSLANIFRELEADLGIRRENGDLRGWARQGVLLLNTALSVPAGMPGGHAHLGWERLAQQVLERVSARPAAFLLWGRKAQALANRLRPGDHLILKAAHPSPLSARRGFFGSRPFSAVNRWLAARGEAEIDWSA